MRQEALDVFGELLMTMVRDRTIAEWDGILSGSYKGATARQVAQRLLGMEDQDIEVIQWLIPHIVDTAMDFLLWALEESKTVDVSVRTESGIVESIKEVSDGLSGELYTEDGWIMRFSKQRYSRP